MSAQDSGWPQLVVWFERATDAAPAERKRLLDGLRDDDPALYARLHKLLAIDASDNDLVTEVARWRDRIFSADDAEAMPAVIGPWRIVRELGSGGMGRVFLAERVEGDYEQSVALKVIRGDFTSDAAIARFLTERRIRARLDHPGIASLIDGDVDDAGRPWFAMQYVQGLSLPDYCNQHALGLEGRLKLMIAVCEAVAYAHRQLVVHCDLKPSNVLVDDKGQPRLLDFGISRLIEAQGSQGQATLTQLRALTPGYAAPEQLAGQPVSVATDVYALGSMLYELLTGVRPYAHSDANAAAVAVAQAQAQPRAPSRAAGAGAPVPARRLRGDLDLVLAKALMHDPAQRYADADALAEDLRRHLGGWPLRARRASTWHRLRKFVGRHRVAVPLGAIAVSALLLVTAFALTQARVAREQASRAEAVRQFLVGVFEKASPDENQGRPISAHELLEKGEHQLDLTPDDEDGLKSEIAGLLGELYIGVGDFSRSLALIERATPALSNPRVSGEVRARILLSKAWIENEDGNYESGFVHARESLALLEDASRRNPEAIAEAHLTIGYALVGIGDWEATEQFVRPALPQAAQRSAICTIPSRVNGNSLAMRCARWVATRRPKSTSTMPSKSIGSSMVKTASILHTSSARSRVRLKPPISAAPKRPDDALSRSILRASAPITTTRFG